MKTIKDYSTTELQNGIIRCEARLYGLMPLGIMTIERVKLALNDYRKELKRRLNNQFKLF